MAALGLKELSPATLDLKKLHSKDSMATEAILAEFPTVLLQSSLKVTYEAPPGIKKDLQQLE